MARINLRRLCAMLLAACVASFLTPARAAFAQPGDIRGLVFVDTNGNGVYDAGEAGVGGVTITFTSGGASVTGTSNTDGTYFLTAEAGAWTVTVTPPPGFQVVGLASQQVNVAAGQDVAINFGLAPVQVNPTITPVPLPAPTATPGILPQTGAPITWRGGLLLALTAMIVVGIVLVISASIPRRES